MVRRTPFGRAVEILSCPAELAERGLRGLWDVGGKDLRDRGMGINMGLGGLPITTAITTTNNRIKSNTSIYNTRGICSTISSPGAAGASNTPPALPAMQIMCLVGGVVVVQAAALASIRGKGALGRPAGAAVPGVVGLPVMDKCLATLALVPLDLRRSWRRLVMHLLFMPR